LDGRSDHAPISSAFLQARSGLALHAVLRGLAQLESLGCLQAIPDGSVQGWSSVSGNLLLDGRVGVHLYLFVDRQQETRRNLTTG